MSRESLKLSGTRAPLPEPESGWSFERRPGGWVIATRQASDGSWQRKRLTLWEARGKLGFNLSGALGFGEVLSERKGHTGEGHGGDADLAAQFPGKVRKLLVQEGQTVAAGDPLLLVEAMKMEFAIKAPFAGKVAKIRVQEGQQLMPGDVFLDLEEKPNGA
jgi:acetyl/propionyl-CoA carboxylase alpha subunit